MRRRRRRCCVVVAVREFGGAHKSSKHVLNVR